MSTGLDIRDGRAAAQTPAAGGFEDTLFASKSVARHYVRGALGLALVLLGMLLTPAFGPSALLIGLPALVLWRGCPTCWTVGLMQTKQACETKR